MPVKRDPSRPVKAPRVKPQHNPDLWFMIYYQQGPTRSIDKTIDIGKSLGLQTPARSTMTRWSSEYNWLARVREAEERAREIETERAALDIVRMNERQAMLGTAMQNIAAEALSAMQKRKEPLTSQEIAALVREGVKTERLARGAATSREEIVVETWTVVMHEIVNLFVIVNAIEDAEQRTKEFADGVDQIAERHVAAVLAKGA